MKDKISKFRGTMSDYLVKKLRQTRISKRLLISFLTISIVPIVLIFLVVNTTSINLIKENIIANDKISSKLITSSISDYISRFDSITNDIIWNTALFNDIQKYEELSMDEKHKFNNQLSKILRSRTKYVSDISDFTIFNENLDVVYNEGVSYIKHEVKLDEITQGLKENKVLNWTSIKTYDGNHIAITKPIKINNKIYGHIFLAIKEKVILNMYKDYNINFNGYGLIVDDKDRVISTNNSNLIEMFDKAYFSRQSKDEVDVKLLKKIDKFTYIVKIYNKKFILTTKPISYASWNLVGAIPYDYIYFSCMNIYKTYTFVGIAIILLSLYIAIIINKSIAKPINEIVHVMNKVNEDTIGKEMYITGNDEISFIMKRYNKMTKKMSILIDTVRLREKEKREVTLRMLQAQINPHFLFNTLGTLRYVSIMNNDITVSNGIEALAKLLRSTILNKDEFISIEDEIENVKNYITIQKIRYGDTFDIDYLIDEEVLNERILKFILQPIVENCILHGFEESSELNSIIIKIYSNKDFINFEIIDNGMGIDEEKLEEGNFNIDKFAGIGVKNIRERLNLYYEGNYVFEITSKLNKGTFTKIIIPKIVGD